MDKVMCNYDCEECGDDFSDELYPKEPMVEILCPNCLRKIIKDYDSSQEIPLAVQ